MTPPATTVDSMTVPLAAARVKVTLSLVGNDGSLREVPLTPRVPLAFTTCDVAGEVIVSGPATSSAMLPVRLFPSVSLPVKESASVPLKALVGV